MKLTPYQYGRALHCSERHRSECESKKDENWKDDDLYGTLVHGVQSGNHNHWYMFQPSESLGYEVASGSPPSMTLMIIGTHNTAKATQLPEKPNY